MSEGMDGEEGADDGQRWTRRSLLKLAGGAGVSAGLGAYLVSESNVLSDGAPASDGGSGRLPFSVWEGMRAGFRASPDHLAGTADELAADGDPEAIFEFVRDEVVTKPARVQDNGAFRTGVDGGPRGALRSGMGTPREKAELLASLLDRAGFATGLKSYGKGISTERARTLYFDWPVHAFDPGFDQAQLSTWREQLGLPPESDGSIETVDEDGQASAELADRVLESLPADASKTARTFDWNRGAGGVPVVKFWSRDGGEGSSAETDATSTTGTQADGGSAEGGVRYADLFHGDESFGSLRKPGKLSDVPDRRVPTVSVTLSAATADAPNDRTELISGTWDADELAGRQLQVDALPGTNPIDKPDVRFVDVQKFVPSLAVQDPHADQATLEPLSAVGDAFSLTGDSYAVEDDGTITKNGEVVHKATDAPDPDTGLPQVPDAAGHIETIDLEADVGGYPTVRLRMDPTDADGNTVGGLPGGAFEVTEDGEPVAVEVEKNERAPRILVKYDGSMSMQIAGFYDGDRQAFRDRMKADLESINPDAVVEFDRVNSNAWGNMAKAATEGADVIVYLSDGDGYTGDHDPAEETAIAEGPPAVLLSITGKRYGSAETMAELSGGTHISSNDSKELREALKTYVGGLEPEISAYRLKYRSPNQDDAGPRTVTVSVPTTDVSAQTSYEVPEASLDPRKERGVVSLFLTVETNFHGRAPGSTRSTRLLAGWDPKLDGGRDPTDADRNEVLGALFGSTVLSFESAGVPLSVLLDDVLTGKLSVESLHGASDSGDLKAARKALSNGVGVISQYPARFEGPLPDRTTEDSITFSTGLRTVLFQQRLQFGSDQVTRSVDLLTTAAMRTLTPDGDTGRQFRLTMERTARLAVLERALYGTSTASVLGDATLAPASDAREHWSDGTKAAFDVAKRRRANAGNGYRVTGVNADTAAHWAIDKRSGALLGVLPDGSGGGDATKRIMGELKIIKQVSSGLGLMMSEPAASAGMGAMGTVIAYQQLLAQLYALASISVATLSAGDIDEQAAKQVKMFACDMVLGMGFDEIPLGVTGKLVGADSVQTLNDASGTATGNSVGCGSF